MRSQSTSPVTRRPFDVEEKLQVGDGDPFLDDGPIRGRQAGKLESRGRWVESGRVLEDGEVSPVTHRG